MTEGDLAGIIFLGSILLIGILCALPELIDIDWSRDKKKTKK